MSLDRGTVLGPYELIAPLGKGGMGEVYRARDTKLGREVAVKILPDTFAHDADRMARFEREAKLLASLNHPNIAAIYAVEDRAIVMELVEGQILKGPLPVEVALNYARQIAEALEAAHEKGIVHRDLKPANIKITPAGTVKILDFGLAVEQASACNSDDPDNSPTLITSQTHAGVILGTAAYMSPEQARGAAVDKRADIWAFGCVLYEIIVGKPAFQGETTSDIVAAVLREEPDWGRVPPTVQPLLRRCFVKDPKHRLRDIGDAMALLEGVPDAVPAQSRHWPLLIAAVFAIALCVTGVGWWRATRSSLSHPLIRLSAELAPNTAIARSLGGNVMALSPDGTLLAFTTRGVDGIVRLATRRLDQDQVNVLAGTEDARSPFFSPDGQWIAFSTTGKLKKISILGGTAVALCDAFSFGGDWGEDGTLVAPLGVGSGLSRIPADGGTPTPITELNRDKGEGAHRWPQILPGGQAILFTAVHVTQSQHDIDVVSLKTGLRKTVYRGGFFGRYLPTSESGGHLVFLRESTLFAAPFDLKRLAVTGDPQPVVENISSAKDQGAHFAFSRNGTFIYLAGRGPANRSIFWLDTTTKLGPLHPVPGLYGYPRFSPDGKRLAYVIEDSPGQEDIWVQDLERDTASRLTTVPGQNEWPVWTPDGKNIIFLSSSPAKWGICWIRADGSGQAQWLTQGGVRPVPQSISPDAKWLAIIRPSGGSGVNIFKARIEGDPDHLRLGAMTPFLETPFITILPAFSPDGRWVAYTSAEPGKEGVWVRPFPGPGGAWQISTGSGRFSFPIWRRNGHELFFLGPDNRIMVASYSVHGDSFVAGDPRAWSDKHLLNLGSPPVWTYDLAPDGKRFAVVLYPDGASEEKPITHLTFLLNFFDELNRRNPVSR